ncbi:hypothetical protein [Pedobacter hartonius]|nr:hypothetical protein [Pedobacter hartonius]
MKKFVLVSLILFLANVGCKKMNADGGRLCGYSPIAAPALNLVIKDSAGKDLLDEKTAGAYSKDKIRLFRKDAAGKTIPVVFYVSPPFSYGDEKFSFDLLYVPVITDVQNPAENRMFLKLGDSDLYELNLKVSKAKPELENLIIDQKEADKDEGSVMKYLSIFYLTE